MDVEDTLDLESALTMQVWNGFIYWVDGMTGGLMSLLGYAPGIF